MEQDLSFEQQFFVLTIHITFVSTFSVWGNFNIGVLAVKKKVVYKY